MPIQKLGAPIAPRHASAVMQSNTRLVMVFAAIAACLGSLPGCASRSTEVLAVPASEALYERFSCEQLRDELDRIDAQTIDAAARVDERFADNAALILVSGLVWPAALAIRGDGEQAQRLGMLRGRRDAAAQAIRGRGCPRLESMSDPEQSAMLQIWPGDRYVYQLSPADREEWTMEVTAVRVERVELQGGRWIQDRAGNRLPVDPAIDLVALAADGSSPRQALPYVMRLLQPGLQMGRSTRGVLVPGTGATALDVTGQVVGIGPATLAQGTVPSVTLELEGRLIDAMSGLGAPRPAVRGVLVVDSRNGMLIRLQTQTSPGVAAVDVRLLRIEPGRNRPAAQPSH